MKENKAKNVVSYRRNSEIFFRIGLRYASERKFEAALKFLSKAVEKEPFNADYQMNLACVLTELHDIEKSNRVLLEIIKNIDPTLAECYFGLACNYFDVGDFKKAREYLEKYIYYDQEGCYSDEAYDILYYLQIYGGAGGDSRKNRMISRLEAEGKKLLESGNYIKAIAKFEKIVEFDPEIISARNNLSLTYFLSGEVDKAISLAKSVLKLDPDNVSAHCNLVLFYVRDKKLYRKQLEVLSKLEIGNKQDFLKVLFTCIELKEYAGITKTLESYLRNSSKARQTLRAVMNDENIEQYVKAAIEKVLNSRRAGAGRKIEKDIISDKVVNFKKRIKR